MGLGEQPNKEAHASLLLTTISNNVLHTYTYKIYLHARVFFFFFLRIREHLKFTYDQL